MINAETVERNGQFYRLCLSLWSYREKRLPAREG